MPTTEYFTVTTHREVTDSIFTALEVRKLNITKIADVASVNATALTRS